MNDTTRMVLVALSFVLIFLSGIGVSRRGRPLSVARSTVHKLLGLAAGIFLLVTVVQESRGTPLTGPAWIAIVLTGLCFAAVVASGAMLSSDKPKPVALLRVHQLVPILTVLSTAAMLYLVLSH